MQVKWQDLWNQRPAYWWLILLIPVLFILNLDSSPSQDWQFESEIAVEEEASSPEGEASSLEESRSIYVDIKGAVRQPGVYEMQAESRLFDLVDQAGGLLPEAASLSINLAQRLEDQMLVYVMDQAEWQDQVNGLEQPSDTVPLQAGPLPMGDLGVSTEENLVNINTADQALLETIPGIGPAKAQTIISYRQEQGSFQTIEAIQEVSGIGVKTFEKLKDYICVN